MCRVLHLALLALVLALPVASQAADWSPKAISSGQATWSEPGADDSGLFCVWSIAKCTNNHASTAVWLYTADGGTKAAQPWAKVPAATSCYLSSGFDTDTTENVTLSGNVVVNYRGVVSCAAATLKDLDYGVNIIDHTDGDANPALQIGSTCMSSTDQLTNNLPFYTGMSWYPFSVAGSSGRFYDVFNDMSRIGLIAPAGASPTDWFTAAGMTYMLQVGGSGGGASSLYPSAVIPRVMP